MIATPSSSRSARKRTATATLVVSTLALAASLASASAHASLTPSATFTGVGYGVSTSGCGSTTQTCTMNATVPAGATILRAILYTSTANKMLDAGGTFEGNAITYNALGSTTFGREAGRADVTAFVSGGGAYTITETGAGQDGGVLVIVYDDPASTALRTVGILDGFSAVTGDAARLSFSAPIDKTAPDFVAEMRLGIGFSANGAPCGTTSTQVSTVAVNNTTITESAGCNDDSVDANAANGNLITIGDDNDAFSPFLPAVADDHERYNLVDRISNGDTSIGIRTLGNEDDNIFLAVLLVSGAATFGNAVPEPTSLALVGLGLAGVVTRRRRPQDAARQPA